MPVQRVLSSLLVFFILLTLARSAVAQFVPPPPPPPITQGYHCQTREGMCKLKAPFPLGRRCTCQAKGGPVPGQTVR
jgi:hypothetical protein